MLLVSFEHQARRQAGSSFLLSLLVAPVLRTIERRAGVSRQRNHENRINRVPADEDSTPGRVEPSLAHESRSRLCGSDSRTG
jgi:hypothetical protein